jgi:hypothetical protein
VQINNKDINTTQLTQAGQSALPLLPFPATVTNDGFYRVIERTTGREWDRAPTLVRAAGSRAGCSNGNGSTSTNK